MNLFRKISLLFAALILSLMAISCEDDPLLEKTHEQEDCGSYCRFYHPDSMEFTGWWGQLEEADSLITNSYGNSY